MASATSPMDTRDKPKPAAIDAAIKALDDLGRAGLAVAPLEPTAAMIRAALRVGGVSEAQIIAIYFAMLSAHAKE
ncbi:MAG: hypothetical protein ACTSV1_03325 [Alphaproteobacteria bacterium]